MLSGQIDLPKRSSSAVDAFVAKGQPPAVLLGHLTALAKGGTRIDRHGEQKYYSDTGSDRE